MKLELPKELQQMEDDDYGRITDIEDLVRRNKDDILGFLGFVIAAKIFHLMVGGFQILGGLGEKMPVIYQRFETNWIVLILSILSCIYVAFWVDR